MFDCLTYIDLMSLLFIFLQARSNDMFLSSLYSIVIKIAFLQQSISCSFLCPDECGLYGEKDRTGPRLHNLCISMNNKECRVEAMRNQTTKIMLQNRSNKIVGGLKSKHPMPWMALIRMGEKFKSTFVMMLSKF